MSSRSRLRRLLLGNPLPTAADIDQRLTNTKALAVFSSDALSSVAYGTEEILWVLVAAGAVVFSIPIHLALALLLAVLTISYRQTIAAYPNGGGSYIVAKDNLGTLPGLVAGASLLTDYILTVAVSVSAGIAAITSLSPLLLPYRVELALLAVLVIMLVNLRGVKESGTIFAVPTYAFLASTLLMIGVGLFKTLVLGIVPVNPLPIADSTAVVENTSIFLVLRAFAAGCTSLTGVEAISNGVPAFIAPEARNARKTMTAMATLLGVMLIGMGFLSSRLHVAPSHTETIMSQIATQLYGRNPLYVIHQILTMLILILAANTSFADFPRLSNLLSRDKFLPRQMAIRGDRLVYSNGIIALAILSGLLIVIFGGTPHALLPLYAVGVFTSFTLSQIGMVIHWYQLRKKQRIAVKVLVNGAGAVATAIVTVIIMVTKFSHGAWIVVLLIPMIVLLLLSIYRHYEQIKNDLRVGSHSRIVPESRTHEIVLLIGGTTNVARTAIQYVLTLVSPETHIRAVHVNVHKEGHEKTEERRQEFEAWVGDMIHLDVLEGPYRSVLGPLDDYLQKLRVEHPDSIITLVIPEFIPSSRLAARLLHGGTGRVIYKHFHDRDFNVIVVPHRVS